MKKLLIAFLFLPIFLFSNTSYGIIFINNFSYLSDAQTFLTQYRQDWFSSDKTFVEHGTQRYITGHYSVYSHFECLNGTYIPTGTSIVEATLLQYGCPSSCPTGQIFDSNTSSCSVPAPTCTTNQVLVTDSNGSKTCQDVGLQGTCTIGNVRLSTGECSTCSITQHYDLNTSTCFDNCTPTLVSNPDPLNWIDLGISTQNACNAYLQDTEVSGSFVSHVDLSCNNTASSACYGSPKHPCNNLTDPLTLIPNGGYIYKGIVQNSSICSSYVDGLTFIDSQTAPTDTDCAKNTDLYCYLLPLSTDGNITNATTSPANPDGTIPNDNNYTPVTYNSSSNTTDPNILNNQILQDLKNNLKDSSLNVKDYHSWFKNKFGKWEPQTNAINELNAQNDTTSAVNNVKTSVNNVTTAIHNQNSNLGTKLDTINQSIKDNNLSVKIDLNTTNDLLTKILNGKVDGNSSNNSSGVMSYINTTYSNMILQYDNIKGQIDNAIDIFNGKGLSTVLTSNSVATCPKSFNFNISSTFSKQIIIDPCIVFTQSREYMYTFSYIGFSIMYISFLVSMLVKV